MAIKKKTLSVNAYNPELVVMKNPILNAKLDFSPLQAQIMLEMIAKIHPADENFNEVRIKVKDFADKMGIEHPNIYKEIDKATHGMNKWVYYIDEADKSISKVTLLTKVKYKEGQGYVDLKFHEDLKPFLLQIKESQFFSYHIEATRQLKNYSFIKLYWLLASWKSIKTKIFYLGELKQTLELEGQYNQFPDFRKRVLHPARAAFIKYGEFYFDFEEIRATSSQKSPVEKVKFTILPNPNWKKRKALSFVDVEPVQPDMTDPKLQDVLKGIFSLSKSISEAQAMQFIRNHTSYKPEDIMSEIIAMKKNKANGAEYSNPLAALSKAVTNNYSTGLYEEQERKRQEQEEQNMINAWRSEFEERFNEFKHTIASEATPQEVELYREAYPTGFNTKGEPFRNRLGNFVAISRGLVPQDEEQNFTNWVRKHKGESLQKLDNKWKVVKTLF
jgi:hypothetical protein